MNGIFHTISQSQYFKLFKSDENKPKFLSWAMFLVWEVGTTPGGEACFDQKWRKMSGKAKYENGLILAIYLNSEHL